jgi:hypothetical protein
LLTITCGGVAGLVFAAASVSRWEYVTNPIATAAITIPGSIHRLACDRFLVRRLSCAAVDRLVASFTSQPLGLRIAEPKRPILWQSVHQALAGEDEIANPYRTDNLLPQQMDAITRYDAKFEMRPILKTVEGGYSIHCLSVD